MTEQSFKRAEEIRDELQILKDALSQVNKWKIFDCDRNSCRRSDADPFLSVLHSQLVTDGVQSITDKIGELQREFEAL